MGSPPDSWYTSYDLEGTAHCRTWCCWAKHDISEVALLTHWDRVTHICVSKLAIIGSHNGLSPDRRQAIIWTNAGLLLIWPIGTNFSEILIEILIFSFKKMRLKVSSAKHRPFCLGLNVLKPHSFRDYRVYTWWHTWYTHDSVSSWAWIDGVLANAHETYTFVFYMWTQDTYFDTHGTPQMG